MASQVESFVGHEVRVIGFPPIVNGLKARGLSPELLVQDVPYTVDDLTKDLGRRIDWESFCRIMENLRDAVGEDGIVEIGRAVPGSRSHRFGVVIGRLLFSTSEFYRWTATVFTNHMKSIQSHVVDLADNRILVEYEMKNGYKPCREIFLLVQGMYMTNPMELGVGRTELHTEFTDNGVRYDIEFNPAGGKLSWLRKSIAWIWTARSAAETLRAADEVIAKRYADLLDETRARQDAEEALVRIAEREQERIRRDLHDRVGQELTGLSFLARRLVRKGDASVNNHREDLEAILDGIERTIGEVQSAIKGIQPIQATPTGLMDALDDLVTKTVSHTGANCSFECPDLVSLDDVATASQLFYIAQEALNNACKYANASAIRVQLAKNNGHVELAVRDNGVGLAQSDGNGTGYGLNIMRHRANLVNGTLDVETPPEGGVAVVCTVPVSSRGAYADHPNINAQHAAANPVGSVSEPVKSS